MTTAGREPSARILCGTAKQEINPALGVRLVRYPNERPNTGVALDLYVRAAVFGDCDSGKPSAALAVLDSLYVHPEIVSAIRERAAKALPGLTPDMVMIAATHTHSGPLLRAYKSETEGTIIEPDPQHLEKVRAASTKALVAAWESRGEVTARSGRTEARLGHNRRVVDHEGRATNEWRDPDGRHTGYFDATIRFVVFNDLETDLPRAVLVGYGCHPVTLGPENTKVSGDYPGYLVRKLEAETGARTAIHLTTGGADINPRRCLFDDPEKARPMAEALADRVLASIQHARPLRLTPISVSRLPLELVVKPDLGEGPKEFLTGRTVSSPAGKVVTEVQAIRLGDLALVGAPGELFAEIVTAVENVSPIPQTIVVGHANDAIGYICTQTAVREGGYEARRGAVSDDAERPFLAAVRKALAETAGGG